MPRAIAEPPPLAARPEPQRRLAPQARTLWTLRALAECAAVGVVVVLVLGTVDAIGATARLLIVVAAAAAAVVVLVIVPQLQWRRWRWEVRPEEIDLRHGTLTEVRTIVPMARVQHVDVRRTFLAQRLGTADLVVHTAAGTTTIPVLPEAAAVAVRDRIADLARTPDEL